MTRSPARSTARRTSFGARSCTRIVTLAATIVTGFVCTSCGAATSSDATPTSPGGTSPPTTTPTVTVGINDSRVRILATNLRFPYNVVVDATTVYWNDAETGSIGAVPINSTGTSATLLVPAGSAASFDLAQDATDIYFTLNDRTLRKVSKAGGASSVLTNATTALAGCVGSPGMCNVYPSGVLVASGRVIFGNSAAGGGAIAGSISPSAVMSVSASGGGVANHATANAPTASPGVLLTASATTLYFAYQGEFSNNVLRSVPLGGGSATNLLSLSGGVSAILAPASGAGAGSIFLLGRVVNTNTLTLRKISGTTVTTLATVDVNSSRSIAVDDTHIYYPRIDSRSDGTVIAKMSLTTGVETILAGTTATNGIAGGLAVDATNVYWAAPTATGRGSIRSVPKN